MINAIPRGSFLGSAAGPPTARVCTSRVTNHRKAHFYDIARVGAAKKTEPITMNNRDRIPAISSFLASRCTSRLPCWLVDSQRFLMSSIFEKLIGRSRVVRFAFTISVSTSEIREKDIHVITFRNTRCSENLLIKVFNFDLRNSHFLFSFCSFHIDIIIFF